MVSCAILSEVGHSVIQYFKKHSVKTVKFESWKTEIWVAENWNLGRGKLKFEHALTVIGQ